MCREIKSDETLNDIPVILFTSLSEPEDIILGLESGADNFVPKSCSEEYLLTRIEYVLINSILRRERRIRTGIEIYYSGKIHIIHSDQNQILDMLISTFEHAVQQNRELTKMQLELKILNEQLEEKVKERTVTLTEEISQRKRIEEALQENKRFIQRIIDTTPNILYLYDIIKHRNVYINHQVGEILGHTPEEIRQMGAEFRNLFCPDDFPQVLDGHIQRFATAKDGEILETEYKMKHANGEWRWLYSRDTVFARTADGLPQLILGTAEDITERKRAEEELRQSSEKLRKAMEGTIQTIALMMEMRDPYTAGHERRVARLSCAIARKMGLSEEQIEGIHVSGFLHDIGKIVIPAEILTKPGRINEYELSFIKIHPQAGYDILKGLEFPWPVARAVLQHHERLDGSGYPAGLSGEELIPEAKILGVADPAEAMASHRPYRPALGLDKALEEISQGRAVLYDPEVVDACLKLFLFS